MELSEEFILELTQVQQRLFGFLFKRLADREQAREVLQRTNLVPGTNFKDWAMTVANYEVMAYRKKSGARPLARQDRSRLRLFKLWQRTTTTTNHIQT
jgi:hypothetical protein